MVSDEKTLKIDIEFSELEEGGLIIYEVTLRMTNDSGDGTQIKQVFGSEEHFELFMAGVRAVCALAGVTIHEPMTMVDASVETVNLN